MPSRVPRPGESLFEVSPDVAAQWHPTLNGAETPSDFTSGSHFNAWWKCPVADDHVWQMKIQNRAKQGQGCPFCSGRRPSSTNNLHSWCIANGELGALLIEQFSHERNAIRMDQLTVGSKTDIWWECTSCGEVFVAPPNRRTSMKSGCPFCSGHRVGQNNSLATLYPKLLSEWDLDRNGDLRPDELTPGSNKKVWWRCNKGPDHVWAATPASRTGQNGTGCPFCRGLRASMTNSLATLRPDLSAE
ncbi:MAG: hypothetical protein RLZZ305_939, partial [Actinomycetota bacterium]